MRTFDTITGLRAYLRAGRTEEKTIGFVPTMGALHEGHLSLIRKAKSECDIVVLSIYVNATQFDDPSDYEKYPRDHNKDMNLAADEEVDAVFMPTNTEMYPSSFQTVVDVQELGQILEGQHRPGHFRGVATIVNKLFQIVQPDRAYFGQKDFQQLAIIEAMVNDLHIPISIVGLPTIRDEDGLALSSRNMRLDEDEREAGKILHKALVHAENYVAEAKDCVQTLIDEMTTLIRKEPLATIDYIALVDPDTLTARTSLRDVATQALVAVRIGDVRLIDNRLLLPEGVAPPKNRSNKS